MSVPELERSIDSLGGWLVFWTIIVALGLAVEYTEAIKNFFVGGFRWIFRAGERPLLTRVVIGGLLITIGVIMEGWIEFRLSNTETELRKANDEAFTNLGTLADKAAGAAGRAEISAQKANDQAGIAKQRAKEIGTQAAELRRRISELSAQLETAETEASAERTKEVELEKSIAPRIIGFQVGPGNNSSFEELKPFAGVHVEFEVLTDAEARRAAQEIGNLLGFAGWKTTGIVPNSELYTGYFDGVSIWYERLGFPSRFPPSPEEKDKIDAAERCRKAAMALEAYLLSKNWKVMARPYPNEPNISHILMNVEHEIPPNTLVIEVGFKPNPFFEPDWVKQMEEQYKQLILREKELEKRLPQPSQPPKN